MNTAPTISTKMRPGKTISTKELAVVANFTNGFAENVIELSDGTLIFISYGTESVRIVERELLDMEDPLAIQRVVNSTQEEA